MSAHGRADVLAGVPEALRPLLPELCEELRHSLAAALAAAGGGQAGGGKTEQPAAGRGSSGPGAKPARRASPAPGDAPESARLAHAFKSASMLYGLAPLARAAGAAEVAAREGRLGEARKALERCGVLLGELESACAAPGRV